MKQLRDILFLCNPCVMCKNNVFRCKLSNTCTCNAEENWKKLIEHLNLLENDNKSMRHELDSYYDKNNAVLIGYHIQRLGDKFHSIMYRDQLDYKHWVVLINIKYSNISFHGIELIEALQKAVAYVEGEEL